MHGIGYRGMERVCIVGSGNWGSCIARIAGANVARLAAAQPEKWDAAVRMWVFEERVATADGEQLLSAVINERHENVKYLPGVSLPENVVAVPDLGTAAENATLVIVVLPHQFVARACATLAGRVAPNARAISLVKGLDLESGDGGVALVSDTIRRALGIDVAVLMGANLANDVARELFSESTLGGRDTANLAVWRAVLETPYFQLATVADATGVELCGALKNVVATAAGLVDGHFVRLAVPGSPDNTKAAVIRRGIIEMRAFCRLVDDSVLDETFLQSCGIADVVTSSYGGRNRRVAAAFAEAGGARTLDQLEAAMLGGQKLQGPPTAAVVYKFLASRGLTSAFPVFSAVFRICYEGAAVDELFISSSKY